MNIIVVGINHQTASIDTRERFFLNNTQQDLLLSELKGQAGVAEAFVLSTCNRTEIYAHIMDKVSDADAVMRTLFTIKNADFSKELLRDFYTYYDQLAVYHLLCVCAGLDSLILGENEILGQVKNSFERSIRKGIFTRDFNVLSNIALEAGKKARCETAINCGGSSVSWAAVMMAEKLLRSLEGRKALIIGAGKMGEITAHQLSRKKMKLVLVNRTEALAQELANRYGGKAVPFSDIKEIWAEMDFCVVAAGAPHYILEKHAVECLMKDREGRQLFLIDISMPRNIDPKVAEVENVALYYIDDLDNVLDTNRLIRMNAIKAVESIVYAKIAEFYEKYTHGSNAKEIYRQAAPL